jgi:hypothetical protein
VSITLLLRSPTILLLVLIWVTRGLVRAYYSSPHTIQLTLCGDMQNVRVEVTRDLATTTVRTAGETITTTAEIMMTDEVDMEVVMKGTTATTIDTTIETVIITMIAGGETSIESLGIGWMDFADRLVHSALLCITGIGMTVVSEAHLGGGSTTSKCL